MLLWSRTMTPHASNCYIIACPETRQAIVIDPGEPSPWIKRIVKEHELQLTAIVLTHGHVDHIGGVGWLKSFKQLPVLIHRDDAPMLTDPRANGSAQLGEPVKVPKADRYLTEGEPLTVGTLSFDVIHTPGHSPGGVCLYRPGHLIAGDTLFAGSVGRTDLWGGSQKELMRSLHEKLLVLPPETVVYPGHEGRTTIGHEAETNPYLR